TRRAARRRATFRQTLLGAERRLVERAPQLFDGLEHLDGACFEQLLARPAAGHDAHGRHIDLGSRLHVPTRVSHHDGLSAGRLLERGADEIGLRLRLLDVGLRGPGVDERANVEQIQMRQTGSVMSYSRNALYLESAYW